MKTFFLKEQPPVLPPHLEQRKIWGGMLLVCMAGLLGLSWASPQQGAFTATLLEGTKHLFGGWGRGGMLLIGGSAGFYLILEGMGHSFPVSAKQRIGFGLLFLTMEAGATILTLVQNPDLTLTLGTEVGTGGGWVGSFLVGFTMFWGEFNIRATNAQ